MSASIVFSCVVDHHPRFTRQAILWVSSLLTLANQNRESLLVHLTSDCGVEVRKIFQHLGVETQEVTSFDARHPASNKLQQLESTALAAADYVVLCDCDLTFCEDISGCITGENMRAKIVDIANLSVDHWRRIFLTAGLPLPPVSARSSFDNAETVPSYCNGGLLVLPQRVFGQLR